MRKSPFFAFIAWLIVLPPALFGLEFSDVDLADVNRLSRLIGQPADKPTLAYLEEKRKSSNEAVSVLAYTALFVHAPKKHRDDFMEALAIDDYAVRQGGKKEVVSFGYLQALMNSIDARAKGDKDDERIIVLIELIELKQKNLWFEGPGGLVSLSRFLRGMYLGSALAGTKLDAEKIANEIDEKTRKRKV